MNENEGRFFGLQKRPLQNFKSVVLFVADRVFLGELLFAVILLKNQIQQTYYRQ